MTEITPQEEQRRKLTEQLRAAQRLRAAKLSRDSLIEFTKLTMPTPDAPEDPTKSIYDPQYFHQALAAALEEVEKGEIRKLIITFPPRHGKSELTSRRFPAWLVGRDPYRHVMLGTYNQPFAEDFGKDVRKIMRHPAYAQVFPHVQLAQGEAASDRLRTEQGGMLAFVGRGGSSTGRGADFLILDDPLKDRAEASSAATREELWKWFTDTMSTRLMSDTGAIVLIQCMTGDTPVLMEDGRAKALSEIRPGDRVASYANGKLVAATVRNWAHQGCDRVFTIKMKSGITVRANARHPFLVREDGQVKWRRTDSLRKGSVILRAIGASGRERLALRQTATSPRNVGDFARRTTTKTDGRTAFGRHLSIRDLGAKRIFAIVTELMSLIMSAFLPSRAVFALSASNHRPVQTFAPIGEGNSASITATTAQRFAAFFATTVTLRSVMARLSKFSEQPLSTFAIEDDVVVDVSDGGTEDVFDIQVDGTENFIANGLVSHNTRWHEDDLIGRLTDKNNPSYVDGEAEQWKIINIPAIAEEDDVLGRKPGEALWPSRFGIDYLRQQERLLREGFSALYQQRPTPMDGDFFRRDWLKPYGTRAQVPERLRIYAASDHAVSTKQSADLTCMIVAGVDDQDEIWLLDCWWQRAPADVVADQMLALMRRWKPIFWWAESGHISKAIGPFLQKRMREEKVYCALVEQVPAADKQTRATSIQGRMAMGMVHMPAFAPWYAKAVQELLKFPHASRDDFVDALAHLGLGLRSMQAPAKPRASAPVLRTGSFAWIKQASEKQRREREARKAMDRW